MSLLDDYKELPDEWVNQLQNQRKSDGAFHRVLIDVDYAEVEGVVYNCKYLNADEDIKLKHIEDIQII